VGSEFNDLTFDIKSCDSFRNLSPIVLIGLKHIAMPDASCRKTFWQIISNVNQMQ
jgi:hypothetical protein